MNISSIVVMTNPDNTMKVVEDLKNSGLCDYHIHDELGRIIITIEGDSISEEMAKLKIIETMPNIISANMQMSYTEEELDSQKELIEKTDAIPGVLLDDNARAEDIIYNGDLKKKVI